MSDITTVKANIDAAIQCGTEAMGALQQANAKVEEAEQKFNAAIEGSDQADVGEAKATFSKTKQTTTESQQGIQQGIQQAEAVKARL